jgi:geranylgeranyl reductase family protein
MFDVAIIGGGPAGTWAARQLALGGARVALLDGSHPREKPCGGGVTGRALALIGSSVATLAGGVPVESASFEHGGRRAAVGLADAHGLRLAVVSRREFDGHLLTLAERAGAHVHRTRAVDLSGTGSGWKIETRTGVLEAGWVIGADGTGSLVRRRVSTPFARADLSIASGYYVHGLSSRQIAISFEPAPAGYLWSFPRPDHLAVGTCAQADETSSEQMLAVTARWLDRHVSGGRRERYSWPIPSLRVETLRRERPSGDRWMLVGDAAGLVDPITREGIFFALTSGGLAAECLLRGSAASTSYAARLREGIYEELILAARLRARFFRPEFMALLVSALQRSARIRAVMADLVAGEQPYKTLRRRLLKTFELRLMLELFGRQPLAAERADGVEHKATKTLRH